MQSFKQRLRILVPLLVLSFLFTEQVSHAKEWRFMKKGKPAKQKAEAYNAVSNYQIFDKGKASKNAKLHLMHSQMASSVNDHERAVALARRSVDLDPDNMPARISYAEALFQKLCKLQEHGVNDVKTYNECVRTWLVVHRNQVGEEAGLSFDGISIPGVHKFFEDEDQGIKARKRLQALCGRLPRFWETNKHYLKDVLKPETSVNAGIVNTSVRSSLIKK